MFTNMWWIKSAFMMLFHPVEMVTLIKRKRTQIPFLAMTLPFLICAVIRVISVYAVNYTVATVSPKNANVFLEIGTEIIPVLLWSVACYAFMTIMGGESTFKETLVLSAYSMVPVIVMRPLMILLSWVLSFSEKGFYDTLSVIMWIWVIALLFITFMEANNLSFGKSIFFTLIIVVAMFLIVIVLLLAFALDSQIVLFVQEIISELNFFFR